MIAELNTIAEPTAYYKILPYVTTINNNKQSSWSMVNHPT